MNVDIFELILFVRPKAKFSLNGNSYEGIIWNDPVQEKPSLDELNSAIDQFKLLKAKKRKKEEIFDYFTEKKDQMSVSVIVNNHSYHFSYNLELLLRLDSHMLHRDQSALFLWVKSNDGLVRLKRKQIKELSCLMQNLCTKIEILIDQNIERIEEKTTLEEVENYQVLEELDPKYK